MSLVASGNVSDIGKYLERVACMPPQPGKVKPHARTRLAPAAPASAMNARVSDCGSLVKLTERAVATVRTTKQLEKPGAAASGGWPRPLWSWFAHGSAFGRGV
jgi:hypothetical protein